MRKTPDLQANASKNGELRISILNFLQPFHVTITLVFKQKAGMLITDALNDSILVLHIDFRRLTETSWDWQLNNFSR